MIEPQLTCGQTRDLAAGYVLGALERVEESAVRDHLATCPEPHPELALLGGVVPTLVELDDLELVEPPPALRERIMAAAAADLAAYPRGTASDSASVARPTRPATPVAAVTPVEPIAFPGAAERGARRERGRTSRFDWALRIAAVIAIVTVGGWGLGLQGQLDAAHRFDAAVARVVQTGALPGAKTVVLAAAKGASASGIAAVAGDGSVVLAMRDLVPTSGSQVYEAWVIVGQQPPLAVGGFTVDGNGIAGFTTRPATTPPGAIIALTLEPSAGNTVPRGPVVSSGVAGAALGQSG